MCGWVGGCVWGYQCIFLVCVIRLQGTTKHGKSREQEGQRKLGHQVLLRCTSGGRRETYPAINRRRPLALLSLHHRSEQTKRNVCGELPATSVLSVDAIGVALSLPPSPNTPPTRPSERLSFHRRCCWAEVAGRWLFVGEVRSASRGGSSTVRSRVALMHALA